MNATPTPSNTAASEETTPNLDDPTSAAWLKKTIGNEFEDQYGPTVTIGKVACVTTDHATSKCSAHYDNEGDDWIMRIIVTPGTDANGYPTTYEVVSDEAA